MKLGKPPTLVLLYALLSFTGLTIHGLIDAVPSFPTSTNILAKQASSAIREALADGFHRQIIKLPLSTIMYGEKEEGFVADRAIGWQGGPQETLRYVEPLVKQLLQSYDTDGGLVPRVESQVVLDFDGSSLVTSESPRGALYDVQALLQPNTDNYYLETIQKIEDEFSDTPDKAKRLFLLVNPAWRDRSSWGIFGGEKAQRNVLDRYTASFCVDEFVIRGQRMTLIKQCPLDWAVFLTPMPYEQKAGEAKLLASFADRPTYQDLDRLLLTTT